jgi:DNA-binding HxlR family transcriptional regulator
MQTKGNGKGSGARSGAQTIVLLAAPLNYRLLRALSAGPRQQTDLWGESGSPSQSTLRAQLKRLAELDVIDKQRRSESPGALEYELTASGRDLLFVADVLEHWLGKAPGGPLALGEGGAKAAVTALAESWSTTMLRALAAGPLSLTELDNLITSVNYPALERRLGTMRLAKQVEALPGNGRGVPYAATQWLREGIAPLTAAARWEQRHTPQSAPPITRLDAEAAFLLAVPPLRTAEHLSGICSLAVELSNGRVDRAGVTIEIDRGRVTRCATSFREHPSASVSGSASAWLAALIDGATERLEIDGNDTLAGTLLDCLHSEMFGARVPA